MNNLLVVIDMVEGFLNEGNLHDKNINRIVPDIVNQIQLSLESGEDIVAFKDTHVENDPEFQIYAPHCIKGSKECELVPEIKKFEDQMIIIEKPTTNGFNTEKFKELISKKIYDNITVTGCCTDICVQNFVNSLIDYLNVNNIDTNVIVPENMVDTFGGDNHNPEEVNKKCLKELASIGAKIVDIPKREM